MSTTIAIVEDEVLFRKSISYLLQNQGKYEVVFEGNNGLELLDFLKTNKIPDIILMDIKMPELDGVATTKQVIEKYPNCKIVILSNYDSQTFIVNILTLGAVGYISKKSTPDELLSKINLVVENGFYFKNAMLQYMSAVKPSKTVINREHFSIRELEVLQLIYQQYSATEIAQQLFISSRTVDGHRNTLLEKTQSKNIIGLVIFAIKNNLISNI